MSRENVMVCTAMAVGVFLLATCVVGVAVPDYRPLNQDELGLILAGDAVCKPCKQAIGTTCAGDTNGRCTKLKQQDCNGSCGEDYCPKYGLPVVVRCTPVDDPDIGCYWIGGSVDCGDKWSGGSCTWYDPPGLMPPECWCRGGTKQVDGCEDWQSDTACDPNPP